MKHTATIVSDCMGLGNRGGGEFLGGTEIGAQGRLKAKVFVALSDSDDQLSFPRICKMFHLHLKVRKKRKKERKT